MSCHDILVLGPPCTAALNLVGNGAGIPIVTVDELELEEKLLIEYERAEGRHVPEGEADAA